MSETETETETHFMGQRLVSSPPNTLRPNQAGYERPDPHPDDIYQPTRVTAPAVRGDGTTFEKAQAAFENAQLQHKKFVDGVRADRHRYSDEGYIEQLAMFSDTPAARAVDAGVAQVSERADKAAAQVDKIKRGLSPNGDTAAELRAGRYWDRTRSLLDNAKEGAFGMAQKLIASADRTELGTLLQELPAYLQAHGVTTDWIDAAIGQTVPEYAKATKQLKAAQQALTITRSNAEGLRKSFAQEGYGAVLVKYDPKYDPDK